MYGRFGYLQHILGTGPPNECPMIIGSGDSLESTPLRLEIVSASSRPDVVFDRHYDVSLSIGIVKKFTQSVEQLSLRMDSGGWVLVTEFASKLGISIQELIIRARHYPSECIDFSVWKDSLDTKATHLRAIRASSGHIYSWIRVDRFGTFATLMKFHTYCDLHVFIRPLFLDDIAQGHCHKATPRV